MNNNVYLDTQESDKNVYELSIERIKYLYSKFDNVIISFSGGKDSMAILELTIQVARELNRLPVKTIFFDEEAISYETEKYVRETAQRKGEVDFYWFCLPIKSNNACSTKNPYWYPWSKFEKDKWVRPLPKEAITDIGIDLYSNEYSLSDITRLLFPKEIYGTVGLILGIRAEESMLRRRSVTRKEDENFIIKDKGDYYRKSIVVDNMYRCYPIYDWSTIDIWTAVKKFNWNYNKSYDILNMHGVAPRKQRVGPAFHSEAKKGLNRYKECFPELWEKMQNRVEGANTANKWGNTSIYGAQKKTIEKPANLSWEEYLLKCINELEGKKKLIVARQVNMMWKRHYKKTKDPILAVPHYNTNISWQYLVSIALLGDLKSRKIAQIQYILEGTPGYYKAKEEYFEELKKYEEAKRNGEKY